MVLRALVVVLALVGFVLLLLLVLLVRDPGSARRRIERLFRRPERKPTLPDADHYYRPYWS